MHREPELPDPEFAALTAKIASDRGFQCSNYKDKCLRRRVLSRMRSRGVVGFDEYAALLDRDELEYDRLIRALTINVTKFFRNPDAYAALERLVIPELWAKGAPVRVWSAGCSSGEEAYTVAILLHRHAVQAGEEGGIGRVKIIGTDIDADCIRTAKRARYGDASFSETPPSVAERYFTQVGKQREVVPEIRQLVEFREGDVLRDDHAPESAFDLIVCRNVIIYFTLPSQERLFGLFHSALGRNSALMLGKVETLLGRSRTMFEPISARERLYRKA